MVLLSSLSHELTSLIKHKIGVGLWDLDNTLWKGTLAEGDNVISHDKRFVIDNQLSIIDTVNVIALKNEYETVKKISIEPGKCNSFVILRVSFDFNRWVGILTWRVTL